MRINGVEVNNNFYNFNLDGDVVDNVEKLIESLGIVDWKVRIVDVTSDDIGARNEKIATDIKDMRKKADSMWVSFIWVEGSIGKNETEFIVRPDGENSQVTCGDNLREFFSKIGEEAS